MRRVAPRKGTITEIRHQETMILPLVLSHVLRRIKRTINTPIPPRVITEQVPNLTPHKVPNNIPDDLDQPFHHLDCLPQSSLVFIMCIYMSFLLCYIVFFHPLISFLVTTTTALKSINICIRCNIIFNTCSASMPISKEGCM